MRDPLILITVAGLIGLVVLNPSALQSTLGLIRGIITRTLQIASGAGQAAGGAQH